MKTTKRYLPFHLNGKFYDGNSGVQIPELNAFGEPAPFSGKCQTPDGATFETGIDKAYGERFWNCIKA